MCASIFIILINVKCICVLYIRSYQYSVIFEVQKWQFLIIQYHMLFMIYIKSLSLQLDWNGMVGPVFCKALSFVVYNIWH